MWTRTPTLRRSEFAVLHGNGTGGCEFIGEKQTIVYSPRGNRRETDGRVRRYVDRILVTIHHRRRTNGHVRSPVHRVRVRRHDARVIGILRNQVRHVANGSIKSRARKRGKVRRRVPERKVDSRTSRVVDGDAVDDLSSRVEDHVVGGRSTIQRE